MSDESPNRLVLAFDTDDPEFVRGFELGMLWSLLRAWPSDEPIEHAMVHANSALMVMRMADHFGRPVQGLAPTDEHGVVCDEFLELTFGPSAVVE